MAVRTALIRHYPTTPSKRMRRHLTKLAGMVAGIVAAGSTHLTKLAQKAPEKTKPESRTKRFTRFLQNQETRYVSTPMSGSFCPSPETWSLLCLRDNRCWSYSMARRSGVAAPR